MAQQSDLEKIAIQVRDGLVVRNTYNSVDDSNNYGETHTRALSDQQTPVAGKGTGVFLDTYNGGGDYDINGHPNKPGSGRIKNKAFNEYNEDKVYEHPDTTLNQGQVNFT
jgi:hypothetical protein